MINIPTDAKVVRDSRLTIVRTIGTLYEKYVNNTGGLKDQIKEAMRKKHADFAESDHVVAALRPGVTRSTIDPAAFFRLIAAGKITQKEFLSCVTVSKTSASALLAPKELEAISEASGEPAGPILFTEFKPGISAGLDDLDLGGVVAQMLLRDVGA